MVGLGVGTGTASADGSINLLSDTDAALVGQNLNNDDDWLRIKTRPGTEAAGANYQILRQKANGDWIIVAVGQLNELGAATHVFDDARPNKGSRYQAFVEERMELDPEGMDGGSSSDWSNFKWIR